uniref:Fork-head domain-containing protein n=1 Tax=Labrus bergylta TaxID=56723 RepID=A0A3Q3G5P2_9LABR
GAGHVLCQEVEVAGPGVQRCSDTEDRRGEMTGEEMASKVAEAVERNPPICPHNSSEDTHRLSKPTLSYLALIAKVILSSPSQKLNLASIYRTMEEQFPYLRSRGPGWRNSVRHNLSVNECFVKVSRCEDGRGHYWGINQAHLRDFQQGNFRVYKKARGRREKEREPGDRAASLYHSYMPCNPLILQQGRLSRFCVCKSIKESVIWTDLDIPTVWQLDLWLQRTCFIIIVTMSLRNVIAVLEADLFFPFVLDLSVPVLCIHLYFYSKLLLVCCLPCRSPL